MYENPEYNERGEKILCEETGKNSHMLMDVRVQKLAAGQKIQILEQEKETAVMLLAGKVVFAFEGRLENAGRRSVFRDKPYCLHCCRGKEISVTAVEDSRVLIQQTKNSGTFDTVFYTPEMCTLQDLIVGIGTRFSDFTTASKSLFGEGAEIVAVNTSRFDAYKLGAVKVVADAKLAILELGKRLRRAGYRSGYSEEIKAAKEGWEKEMAFLSSYSYDEDFKPLIGAGDPRTIPEFHKMTKSILTQTAVVARVRELIPADAICVGAAGSLPGDLQRMWTSDIRYSYNMEYGYSCMGYEIAGALGSKLAEPAREVYAMCGDGSYLMLHSELVTSIQEHRKINVLLFDNSGFGCINNLEMSNGIGNLATEFRYRDQEGKLLGDLIPIDFAACAAGYGVKTYRVKNMEELDAALKDSLGQEVSTLIDIKVLPKTMTDGYGAWWHVGVAGVSENEKVRGAHENKQKNLEKARKY